MLTILSNLAFLLPFSEAFFYKHRYTRAMLYLGVIVFSSLYHTCNSFSNACVLNANALRQWDYFFAQFTIPATALYVIYFPKGWEALERVLLIVFAVTIAILQSTAGEGLVAQLSICAVAFGLILVYWVGYAVWELSQGKDPDLPPYDWENFGYGIALTGLASSLFVVEALNHNMRWSIHSVWHILGALGQFWILKIRAPAPKYAVMDAMIREEMERGQWKREGETKRKIHHYRGK